MGACGARWNLSAFMTNFGSKKKKKRLSIEYKLRNRTKNEKWRLLCICVCVCAMPCIRIKIFSCNDMVKIQKKKREQINIEMVSVSWCSYRFIYLVLDIVHTKIRLEANEREGNTEHEWHIGKIQKKNPITNIAWWMIKWKRAEWYRQKSEGNAGKLSIFFELFIYKKRSILMAFQIPSCNMLRIIRTLYAQQTGDTNLSFYCKCTNTLLAVRDSNVIFHVIFDQNLAIEINWQRKNKQPFSYVCVTHIMHVLVHTCLHSFDTLFN